MPPPTRVYGLLTKTAFDVGPRLGAGGGGVVHASLCNQFALKFYPVPLTDAQASRACEWTRLVGAGLLNPKLPGGDELCVPVDVASAAPGDRTAVCVVSRRARGKSLERLLDRHRGARSPKSKRVLPEQTLVRFALGVARCNAAVHSLGPPRAPLTVIRDEKPENYLASPKTGRVWRFDLDDVSMRPVRLPSGAVKPVEGGHTSKGFVSPQEIAARDAGAPYLPTHQDDLYSLGVTIYRVLFPGWDPTEPRPGPAVTFDPEQATRDRHYPRFGLGPHPAPIAVSSRRVPNAVDALFLRCFLTTNRPTAAEWTTTLQTWLDDLAASPPSRVSRKSFWERTPTYFAAYGRVAAIAFVVVAAGIATLWAGWQSGRPPSPAVHLISAPASPEPGVQPRDPKLPKNPAMEALCDRYDIERP